MKLVVREPESDALSAELRHWPRRVASAVLGVEAVRAAARVSARAVARTERLLADVTLLPIADEVLRSAARVQPRSLATLDAVHLATALSLGRDLEVFLAYDARLAEAASRAGLVVASPS